MGSCSSAQGPKKWKFDIPHHYDKSPKTLQVAFWLKVCDANFWSCEYPKHQPWNLKRSWVPFLQPNDPRNGSLTSLIIVISHQKCCKWCCLKVCDANFLKLWISQASALEPEKSWVPFPQPKEPKNESLTSIIIVISHQKCCKWRWLKVCEAIVF